MQHTRWVHAAHKRWVQAAEKVAPCSTQGGSKQHTRWVHAAEKVGPSSTKASFEQSKRGWEWWKVYIIKYEKSSD